MLGYTLWSLWLVVGSAMHCNICHAYEELVLVGDEAEIEFFDDEFAEDDDFYP